MATTRTRVTGAGLIVLLIAGCGGDDTELPATTQMVFVDAETDTAILASATDDLPATHPDTGRRTLMPGRYCAACEKWHPSPPLEVLQRSPDAQQCPVCQSTLTTDGPWPDQN